MSIFKNNLSSFFALACIVWLIFLGLLWIYWTLLFVAIPLGILVLFLWLKLKHRNRKRQNDTDTTL